MSHCDWCKADDVATFRHFDQIQWLCSDQAQCMTRWRALCPPPRSTVRGEDSRPDAPPA